MGTNLKFEEIKKEDDSHVCLTTNSKILSLEWFEDYLYIGTKQNYRMINYKTGDVKQIEIVPNSEQPPMAILDQFDNYSLILLGKGNKVFQITQTPTGLDQKAIDTTWATGENMKIVTHGLHVIMMTE